ncbi:MAG: hypothetical protein MJ138_04745 [Kiritimatiellae bacterium]|nr:hypothetical protein [Kiritimatiellia bacterium]
MRGKLIAFVVAACVFAGARADEAARPAACGLYDYPSRQSAYLQLRRVFEGVVKAGDWAAMEKCCGYGLRLMPGDATWQYNLACALNRQGKTDAALAALAKAVEFGFRDAAHAEADGDLKNLGTLPRFRELLQEMRRGAGKPIPGKPVLAVTAVPPNAVVTLGPTNLTWDIERGRYVALLRPAPDASRKQAVRAANYRGPAADLLSTWLADGAAAGNDGDAYVNRDHDHSPLAVADFPGLSAIRYEAEARAKNVDKAIPNTLFPAMAVFGNASLAIVSTNDSCSLPRAAYADHGAVSFLADAYLDNQFWAFPAHKDVSSASGVDRFPAVSPFALVTEGSSGSDQPYLRLALAASAAFTPETKKKLLETKRLAPTLQALLRRHLKTVRNADDYLTARAHPTAFPSNGVDAAALVAAAHALKPDAIPPVAVLTPLAPRQAVGLAPRPRYFMISPCAVGVKLNATDLVRTFPFHAVAGGKNALPRVCWRVVHGDSARVTVSPGAEPDVHELTVDCRGLTNRVDVACFAKDLATDWGAPSFVSFCPADPEKP